MTKAFSAFLVLGFLALLGSIVWTGTQSNFLDEMRGMWAFLWFRVTMLDLYLGFALFAAWAFYRERCWPCALAWSIAICLLGNLVPLLYIFIALRKSKGDMRLFFQGARA